MAIAAKNFIFLQEVSKKNKNHNSFQKNKATAKGYRLHYKNAQLSVKDTLSSTNKFSHKMSGAYAGSEKRQIRFEDGKRMQSLVMCKQ